MVRGTVSVDTMARIAFTAIVQRGVRREVVIVHVTISEPHVIYVGSVTVSVRASSIDAVGIGSVTVMVEDLDKRISASSPFA